jgi:hypothetical protein
MKTSPCCRNLLLASLGLLTIARALPAWAQDATPPAAGELEALRAQVNKLQEELKTLLALLERLDKLEAQQKVAASAAPSNGTPSNAAPSMISGLKVPLTVTGVMQAQSLIDFSQRGPAPRVSDTFSVRRAQIRITGNVTPRITGLVMFDPARVLNANFRPAANGAGGTVAINRGSSILQDLQLSFLLNKRGAGAKASSNFIDVGQFKVPIGYESTLIPAISVSLVERSLMFTVRDPFGGGYGQLRDTGVQVRGTRGPLSYRLGLFNGLGERQTDLALSDHKALAGLLSFQPAAVPGLQLGLSGGHGTTAVDLTRPGRPVRNIFNTFAVYKHDKLTLQGEYMTGKSEKLGTTTARDIRGYYAGVGYAFTPKIEGLFRYDYFDTNRDSGADDDSVVRDIILGLNYFIKGNNAKIQLNLVRRNGAAGGSNFAPPNDFRNNRTELRTQAQVAF